MENDADAFSDVRNVYMALHHIIKYRGNFLLEGKFDASKFDNSILSDLNAYLVSKKENDDNSFEEYISSNCSDKMISILLCNENKKNDGKY